MFLGLAVFIAAAAALAILAVRAVKSLIRRLSGGKDTGKKDEGSGKPQRKESPDDEIRESPGESESLSGHKESQETSLPEEVRNRYAAVTERGITEMFWTEGTDFTIESGTVADLCVRDSLLTHLEFDNRFLAGDDFYGFNLIIEDDERMVLTYNGQAVASITKVEMETTAVINGRTVEGTAPAYRVNTFPPTLTPGMATSDLENILYASDRIRACGGDPRLAADAMVYEFTEAVNVSKLKGAVDRKIQEKETAPKKVHQEKQEGPSKRRAPRQLS